MNSVALRQIEESLAHARVEPRKHMASRCTERVAADLILNLNRIRYTLYRRKRTTVAVV